MYTSTRGIYRSQLNNSTNFFQTLKMASLGKMWFGHFDPCLKKINLACSNVIAIHSIRNEKYFLKNKSGDKIVLHLLSLLVPRFTT